MSSVVAVVVVYKPDFEDFIASVKTYIDAVDKLLVWQNSSINDSQKARLQNLNSEIEFVGDGTNKGIGEALNYTFKYAKNKEYRYVLSMDQDSQWVNVKQYLSSAKEKMQDGSIAIVGPCVKNYYSSEMAYTDPNPDFLITSGAVYNTDILVKNHGVKSKYVIDAIDEEICYRLKARGYTIARLVSDKYYLIQKFGKPTSGKFLWKTTQTSNYSAERYYYIARNHIWLSRERYVAADAKKAMRWSYAYAPLIKVLLFEKDKGKKMGKILKGIIEGNKAPINNSKGLSK
jgi:rhamnosyltransferase